MSAIFERDASFLKILSSMSISELYSWKIFFESKEPTHSTKVIFFQNFTSIFSISGVITLLKRILVLSADGYFKTYLLFFIFLIAFVIYYYISQRSHEESLSIYNLTIINQAIHIKEASKQSHTN